MKQGCDEHGALSVEWDTEDIADNDDGTPCCYVCDLEERIITLKQSLNATELNRDSWKKGWVSQRDMIRKLEAQLKPCQ